MAVMAGVCQVEVVAEVPQYSLLVGAAELVALALVGAVEAQADLLALVVLEVLEAAAAELVTTIV